MGGKRVGLRLAAGLCLGLLTLSTGCAAGEPRPHPENSLDPFAVEEVTTMGDYREYSSLAEALKASSLVVVGAPLSSKVDMIYPETSETNDPASSPQAASDDEKDEEFREAAGVVVTVTRFRVDEVLSGNAQPGDIVEVQQTGGKMGGTSFRDPSVTLLSGFVGTSERILLGLQPMQELFVPVSPKYGALSIENGRLAGLDGSATGKTLQDVRAVLGTK